MPTAAAYNVYINMLYKIIEVVLYMISTESADVGLLGRSRNNIWKCVLSGRLNRSTKAVPRALWVRSPGLAHFPGVLNCAFGYYSVSYKREVVRSRFHAVRGHYTIIKSRIAKTSRSIFPNYKFDSQIISYISNEHGVFRVP